MPGNQTPRPQPNKALCSNLLNFLWKMHKYTRLVECWFDNMDALKKALTSPKMQHAVEEAMPKITDLVMAFYEEKLQF